MTRLRLKGCPRCGGDLELVTDPLHPWILLYWRCIQAGHEIPYRTLERIAIN